MHEEAPKFVIDNGSESIKAGWAGDDAPSSVFPCVVGVYKDINASFVGKSGDCYIGDEAQSKRNILALRHPIEKGIINNWDDMEKIWYHTFSNEFRMAPEEHTIILTEPPLNAIENKERMIEIMFETFNVPALFIEIPPILSLYASGNTSGTVIDSGESMTSIVPIFEGSLCTTATAITRLELGGSDLTDYMKKILMEGGHTFTSSWRDCDIIEDIKKKYSYVALDFDKVKTSTENERKYKLPDGEDITVSNERFMCPEALFQPSLINRDFTPGIHQATFDSITKCDFDIQRFLFQNVILAGGNTMFDGLKERLDKEIRHLANPKYGIKVCASAERQNSAWIGGSILGSIPNLPFMTNEYMTKAEYDEVGRDRRTTKSAKKVGL